MKKTAFFLLFIILTISLLSCGSPSPSQSTFKTSFSLNSVLEANHQYLLEKARVVSGAETGSTESFVQRYEKAALQVEPANIPDLMEAVRDGVEASIQESGARVQGSLSDGSDHFSFSYAENGLEGTVHVWGVPGKQTDYTLILLITEK